MLQTQSLPDCHQANIAGCSGPVVGLSGPQELPLWSSPNPENTPNTRGCSLLDRGRLTLQRLAGRQGLVECGMVNRPPEGPPLGV